MRNLQNLLLVLLLLIPLEAWSKMEGTTVGKNGSVVKVKHIAALEKIYKGSFQGMDICNGLLLSLQDHGMATLYKFDGKHLERKGMFALESYNGVKETRNHANVAVFSNQYLQKSDKLPLVYITRCNSASSYKGLNQVCYVERINPDKLSSELVQVIAYNDTENLYPHTTQWVLDVENDLLYGYGNSREGNINRHFLMKFKRPPYRGPQDSLVVLQACDVLEKYYLEDTYKEPSWQPVIQGAVIKDNLLYLPMGVGTEKNPSVLYIWNLEKHTMKEEVNLQSIVPIEMEDCTFMGKKLIVQAQKNLFEFTIK